MKESGSAGDDIFSLQQIGRGEPCINHDCKGLDILLVGKRGLERRLGDI